jgi:putative Ca2+/H+ antiporter (TMEM165/GDT1 family)
MLSLLAVLCGAVIFDIIPILYVRVAAAIAFIIFGVWTLCSKEEDDTKVGKKKIGKSLTIIAYVFWLITVAEFGDKTQLATIVLASSLQEPLFIFLGAVAAFFVVDAPGIYFGKKISEKVPVKYIKAISGILFLVLGVYFILEVAGFI